MRPGRVAACVVLFIAVTLAGCAASLPAPAAEPSPAYPQTRTVDVVDDYHGTLVADPYRWLEDTEAPEVRAWAQTQNAFADTHLDDDLRARIAARIRALGETTVEPGPPADEPQPEVTGTAPAVEFAVIPAPDGQHRLLTISENGAEPRVLVDPKSFGPDVDFADYDVGPNDRYVVYFLSTAGSEWVETRIRRIADDSDLPEVMQLLWPEPAWTHDGAGFFYVRYIRSTPGANTMYESPAVMYHRVGTPQSTDRVIHGTADGTTHLALGVQLTPDGRHALISEGGGAHAGVIGWVNNRRWLLNLGDALNPDPSGTPVPLTTDRSSAYELMGQQDSLLYFLTDRNAPRRRLVAVNVNDPGESAWTDVIAESTEVLHDISDIHGRWVATYLDDVQPRVRVFARDGRPLETIDLPAVTTVLAIEPGPTESELDLVTMSFLRFPGVSRYDMATDELRSIHQPATAFDPALYVEEQAWYRSADGTRVPMFIVRPKGIALDGSHPTLLIGYGASHQVMVPGFDETTIAWLELGGIIAIPNLRGGGEFGREWYDAAILARKQTTVDDFIAAAEWLIAQGYTSPARLGMQGASNGGMLVAATMSRRPELFAAAVALVPAVDLLRFDPGRHRAQWGFAHDPAQFPFMFSYAPLQRIRAGTCYPATLIATALNDDRVPAWNAFKLTAALQTAQSCARPVLLRVHEAGGHGLNRGPDAWVEDQAEQMAFFAQRLGATPAR